MSKTKIGDEQLSDEYYDLERILQPSASKVTKSWTEDMLNILEKNNRSGYESACYEAT